MTISEAISLVPPDPETPSTNHAHSDQGPDFDPTLSDLDPAVLDELQKLDLKEEGEDEGEPDEVQKFDSIEKVKEDGAGEWQKVDLKTDDGAGELQKVDLKADDDGAGELQKVDLKADDDGAGKLQEVDGAGELQKVDLKVDDDGAGELQKVDLKADEGGAGELQEVDLKADDDGAGELQEVDLKAEDNGAGELQNVDLKAEEGGEGLGEKDDEVNDNPIEQVRLTVPITDDPSQPTLTFRTWVIGIISCSVLAFLNQFFWYRQNQLNFSAVSAQILVLPVGKLMAATLPQKPIRFPFTNWSFSLNPGPFNLKEHVLITICANCGSISIYAVDNVTIVMALATQMLGYGWAGIFRKYLVDSPYMWWPSNLVQVSLFRALHEKEKRPKGGRTRLQFFFMVFICSFAYYIVPSYLFPSISAFSFVCWIWKDSITAQQIGSGMHGLGIGSFGFDWSTVAGFLGSPLATPGFATINILIGFILIVYIVTPIAYWNNAYEAQKFPIFTSHTYDSSGQRYNISRVLDQKNFDINMVGYNGYSKLYLSTFFAFTYGLSFATLTATISHVALFHGRTIWKMWKKTTSAVKDQIGDVHTRLMKKNYDSVPQWWFQIILVSMVALAVFTCEGFGKQLQLPWWGVLMACGIALFFTLPIGIIQATTNQQPGLNVITELIIGYIHPGRPLANVAFKTYGYISMSQALMFLSDFKLGHYMKIPPKSMFVVQLVGTLVASSVYFGTSWWLLTSIEYICDPSQLPEGSPWTCPGDDVFYNASIIWGVIGPLRMFSNKGVYPEMNLFFLIGLLAPVPIWFLSKKFPNQKWIKLINMPIILGATGMMPPARAVNYLTWLSVGIFFNFYVYRKYKGWWARHNYILSAALDAGVAFTAVLLYFTLQSKDIMGPGWWGLEADDHCPLASCPTAPGVVAKGCPVR